MTKTYIYVKGGMGYGDGDYAIGITGIATRQTTVPPIAFPTPEAAQAVVDAIVVGNPDIYTNTNPFTEVTA